LELGAETLGVLGDCVGELLGEAGEQLGEH